MVATMGCLFSSFRARDSNPSSSDVAVGAVAKKRGSLSSLLVASKDDNDMLAKLSEDRSLGTPKSKHGFDHGILLTWIGNLCMTVGDYVVFDKFDLIVTVQERGAGG